MLLPTRHVMSLLDKPLGDLFKEYSIANIKSNGVTVTKSE